MRRTEDCRLTQMTTHALLEWRVSQAPADCAVRFWDCSGWKSVTWKEYARLVANVSRGLQDACLVHGDRIAIYAETCFEWALVDLAAQRFGGIVVAIHPSYSPEEVTHALRISKPKALFYGGEKPAAIVRELGIIDCPQLAMYSFGEHMAAAARPFSELLRTPEDNVQDTGSTVQESDVATYVFTSGTSGLPKALCLTQRNLVATAIASFRHLGFDVPRPQSLHWLPFAHLFGRIGLYLDLVSGGSATYSRGLQCLPDDLRVAKPDFLFAVPKALSRFRTTILSKVDQQPAWKRRLFRGALKRAQAASLHPAVHTLSKKTLFGSVISSFGGNLRLIIVGSAPVEMSLCRFFEAFGIGVREGYGMTETSGVAFVNPFQRSRFGTVGTAIETIDFQIAPDQELLVRGDSVCKGYLNPADNLAAFTEDGWFRTGDLGAVQADGYVKIVGRKKDIIITDAGENITPDRIEAKLTGYPLIRDVVLIGDKRPYVVAIICVDRSVASQVPVADAVQHILNEVNIGLARFEKIKKFLIAKSDFSVDNGELTPSFKKKRRVIEERYRQELYALYAQEQQYAAAG